MNYLNVSQEIALISMHWPMILLYPPASAKARADLAYTCPQTDVKDHPVSLGVTCCHPTEISSRC